MRKSLLKQPRHRKEDLVKRGKALTRAGYSVIPVQGDKMPEEPKRPAINWKKYQGSIAATRRYHLWFDAGLTAMGIVCGRVSRLLVIDFDDVFRYQRFCRHLPQYSETYTVKTRRGFHAYFRTDVKVPSHQFDGGDIKGEKSYVIAPPSKIGNVVYHCSRNVREVELGREDVDRLLNYFHVKSAGAARVGKGIEAAKDLDLGSAYARFAGRIGRNNALYRVASMGREGGLSKAAVIEELLLLHVGTVGKGMHKYESAEERRDEGLRTIESAFRGFHSAGRVSSGSVPNSVREALLKRQGSTIMGRLLDVFICEGWEAGAYFSLGEAVTVAGAYGMNRKSVMQALTGDLCIFDGQHIISRRYVEYADSGGQKRRRRGRPVELMFRAPSASRLVRLLNVAWSPSDRLQRADLASAKAYRLAMHREYLKRLSPRASLGLLAGRLGVNERTIRRYNDLLDVRVKACIGSLELSGEVVRSLPKRGLSRGPNATGGFWLEAGDGSRLPAWRHIGRRILKADAEGARVCARLASVYSLKAGESRAPLVERMSLREFRRLMATRAKGRGGFLRRLGDAIDALRERGSAGRYERIQLSYGNVAGRIADDKVAATISGYLLAVDDNGAEVRRPAKRGIAYRMLKEFGDGNVYLALRSSYREVMASLARHALRAGEAEQSVELLARAGV